MYARLNFLNVGPGQREFAEGLADKIAPAMRALKGFRSVTFVGDFETGEIGGLSVWETKEDADAAAEAIGSLVQQSAADRLKGPPNVKVFEVYEPKT